MKWIVLTLAAAAVFAATLGPDLAPELTARFTAAEHEEPERAAHLPSERKIFAAGTVEGAQRNMTLAFEIAGRVAVIPVEEGQPVEEGDLLAGLDDAIWRQRLAEAEASLELARAERARLVNGAREETLEVARAEARLAAVQVSQAEADKQRAERLFADDAIPEQNYDNFRFAYDIAVARYRQAWARVTELEAAARTDEIEMADARIRLAASEVDQARTMLEKTRLRAPTDGLVLRVDVEPGELVAPEHAEPVVTMANVDEMRVRAYVEELDALAVSPGQPVEVIADGRPDTRYAGVVTWIAPSMGPKQHRHHNPGEHVDVKVREVLIALDDPQDLVIGLPVEVFITPTAPDETVAPTPSRYEDSTTPQPLAIPQSRDPREPLTRLADPETVFPSTTIPIIDPALRIATTD